MAKKVKNEDEKSSEWISAAEFAKIANVTVQAVYRRLGDKKEYCQTINGTKKFNTTALKLYETSQKNENEEIAEKDEILNPLLNKELNFNDTNILNVYKPLIEFYTSEIARLQKQITEKDARIAEKDAQIADLTGRFAALVEREQELTAKALKATEQAQTLHAISESKQAAQIAGESGEIAEQSEVHRSLFSKIFGTKKEP